MAGRPIVALISLILIAAGILFEFFIILSGVVTQTTPFDQTYFLTASAANIPNANLVAAGLSGNAIRVGWTYFSLVATGAGSTPKITDSGPVHAAFPFKPSSNFGLPASSDVLPPSLRSGNYYYLMSRFAWAFYLIALFFAVVALFTGLLALCSRIGGFLSGFTASIATFFMAIAAALMTAWTVQARNAFNADGYNANLGRYAYGWTWAAFAAYFLAMILFCVSGGMGGKKETTYKERKGFFGRNNSKRSNDGIRSEYS